VIYSHISEGKDFYTYEPDEHWDVMVSNPPFSAKKKIFQRAISFGKPFALLMTSTWWGDSALNRLFTNERPFQVLKPDKRMEFVRPNGTYAKQITFLAMYYCFNFLPQPVMLCDLQKPKK